MKKFIAAAVLAGLAASAFADAPPAPSITWAGYLDTGFTAQFNGDNKAQLGFWGDDAWKKGGRFKLIGKVAAGDAGFNFEIRDQGLLNNSDATVTGNTTYPFYFQTAYAYANFLNKMVYTQAGIIDQRDTRPAGDLAPTFTKETLGGIVVVKPVDGLSVNAFVAPANGKSASVSSPSAAGKGAYVPVVALANVAGNFADTVTSVGAAYTVANVAKVMGQARFYTTYNAYGLGDAYVGANLLAVPNLAASVEGLFYGLNDGMQHGVYAFGETASYNLKDVAGAPVVAGLIAEEFVYGSDFTTDGANKTALGLGLRLTGSASYDLGNGIVPKVAVSYLSGAEATSQGFLAGYNGFDNPLGAVLPTTSGLGASGTSNLNKVAYFELKPSVKFVVAPTQTVNFTYILSDILGGQSVYYLGSTSATLLHSIQANYTYSF
jgi:hypothetical protein